MTTINRAKTAMLCTALGLLMSTAFGGPVASPNASKSPTTAPALQSSIERIYRQLIQDQIKRSSELAAQCEELAGENARLRDQLTVIRRTLSERAANPTPSEPVPSDWRQEEINGMTFYIVPLGKNESAIRTP